MLTAGALQTCAGHDAGVEAAIHAMKDIFLRTTLMLFYWLMQVMPSTRLIIKVLYIKSLYCVHHLVPSLRKLMRYVRTCKIIHYW